MSESEKTALDELKDHITAVAPTEISSIIVFGSHARNEHSAESDVDVAVIVKKRTPELEQRLEDAVYSLMWKHDFRPMISLKVFSETQFNESLERGFLFYRNVAREGIRL